MRTRVSTTVDNERLTLARQQTGLPDSELIDLALATLLERAERDAEDRALGEHPYHLDSDLFALAAGWPAPSPPLDDYDDAVPADVLALFEARSAQ